MSSSDRMKSSGSHQMNCYDDSSDDDSIEEGNLTKAKSEYSYKRKQWSTEEYNKWIVDHNPIIRMEMMGNENNMRTISDGTVTYEIPTLKTEDPEFARRAFMYLMIHHQKIFDIWDLYYDGSMEKKQYLTDIQTEEIIQQLMMTDYFRGVPPIRTIDAGRFGIFADPNPSDDVTNQLAWEYKMYLKKIKNQ